VLAAALPQARRMIENTHFYASLEAFYAADGRRRHSRERDFGRRWRGRRGATYRAAWVQETGEFYVVRHGHPTTGGGTVGVLERQFGLGELHKALSGYQDVCERPGSLGWLLERIGRQRPSRNTRSTSRLSANASASMGSAL
jgi:hypothetical protein